MDEIDILKLRYRCSECKNLESHHASDKKRKCEKCGTVLTEITEKDYQHYKEKKKKKEEEKKEKKEKKEKEKEKKKKKSEKKDEDESPEKEDKKHKHKLKRSSSTKNIEDKNNKAKKENKEPGDLTSRGRSHSKSSSKKKKKKRNRYRSIEKLGPILNKIVSKVYKGKDVEKDLKKLNKLDFSEVSDSNNNNITINHNNNQPTQVLVNNKDVTKIVDTEVFEPLFNTLNGYLFNNFMQNFASSSTTYYSNAQTVVNNNRNYATQHGSKPIKDESLSNLKQFPLSNKYCKKGKDGKYELPSCCICLSEIKKGKNTILLPCKHMFHSKCITDWLKSNNTCPMCRKEID